MATVIIQKRNRKKGTTYPIFFKDPMTGKKKYYKTLQKLRDAQQVANDLRAASYGLYPPHIIGKI